MPRSLTTGVTSQLTATLVRPVFLVSLAIQTIFTPPPPGTVEVDPGIRLWSGVGDLVWDSWTWSGVGELGSISTVSEGSDVTANGITLSLTGIPNDLLNEGMVDIVANRIAQVYLGFMDTSGALIPDPIPAFIGLLDEPQIDISTETSTLTFSVENRLADLNRSRGGRYTDADQRARYPNDGSLRWVNYLQDSHFLWR